MPNDHAVLSHERKQGGCAAAVKALAMEWIEEEYQIARDQFTLHASGTYLEALGVVNTEHVVAHLQKVTLQQRNLIKNGPNAQECRDACKRKLRLLDTLPPPLKPLAIAELGGKVRVATIHSAEEVYFSRCVTARWLSQLRKVVTTRDILKGKDIRLHSVEAGEIYSADLTAATDYIPHEVAQHVAACLCDKMQTPRNVRELILKTLGPHALPDGTHTTCGIHMGLGPTWVILSILNGFAAWNAGARKDSHAICGDDLVALWPERIRAKYASTMKDLGLVLNHSKSFYGTNGVFCERLVMPVTSSVATSQDVGHLSQSSAAHLRAGHSNNRFSVAENLWQEPQMPALSKVMAKHYSPRTRRMGPISLGGNGTGLADLWQIASGFQHGRIPLVKQKSTIPDQMIAELLSVAQTAGDISVTELLALANARLRLANHYSGRSSEQVRATTQKDFDRAHRSRRHNERDMIENLCVSILSSSKNSKTKKAACWLLSGSCRLPIQDRWRRLQALSLRKSANRFVDESYARVWLDDVSPTPWGLTRVNRPQTA